VTDGPVSSGLQVHGVKGSDEAVTDLGFSPSTAGQRALPSGPGECR
jgi:hypothetical protein